MADLASVFDTVAPTVGLREACRNLRMAAALLDDPQKPDIVELDRCRRLITAALREVEHELEA